HQNRLHRQDDGAKDQGHEDKCCHENVDNHPRQLVEECVEGFHLHRWSATDVYVYSVRGVEVFQLVDDIGVIITVFDAGREHRGAIDSCGRWGHGGRQPAEFADLHDDIDKQVIRRIDDDELRWLGAEARELIRECILRYT